MQSLLRVSSTTKIFRGRYLLRSSPISATPTSSIGQKTLSFSLPSGSSINVNNNNNNIDDNKTMKFSSYVPFVVLVPNISVRAFSTQLGTTPTTTTTTTTTTTPATISDAFRISSRLFATVASSAESSSSSSSSSSSDKVVTKTSDSAVIATGTVVAQYEGGLTAVKIQDDDSDSGDLIGHQVILANQARALVVAHRPPLAFCFSSDTAELAEGKVQVLQSLAKVSAKVASVVDAFGCPINEDPTESMGRAIFSTIPQIKDIALINSPVLTGVTMIDALAPIGRGQNMLWITHDVTSSRQYFVDWIRGLNNDPNTPVVYAALDTDEETMKQLPESVQIVARTTTTSDPVVRAAEGVAMGGVACALAEQHALEGKHAIVFVDTLDGYKALWDATTRVLVDVFGIDAVVKGDRDGGASSEMRAFFSSLIQRSAQYKVKRGGGSVTLVLVCTIPPATLDEDHVFTEEDFASAPAKILERVQLLIQKNIPLTEATLRKIKIPIPSAAEGRRRIVLQHTDDLMSMSDGQIWFDEDLQLAGQLPPMDPQRSVTRIGIGADTLSRADAPALRKVVEGLRLLLSQAKDHLQGVGSQSGDAATAKEIMRSKALFLALHQQSGTGARRLSESCALLLAATQGLLDNVVAGDSVAAGEEAGQQVVNGILNHLHHDIPKVMNEIDDTLDLTDENKASLLESLNSHLVKGAH